MATAVVDVVMPQMGVSVSEGTILKWLKQEGETIEADEPLLEISTDKVDTEVPSPGSGVVQQILVAEGETVDVGTRLAVIAPEGADVEEAPAEPEPAAEEPLPSRAAAAPPRPPPTPPPAPANGGAGERTFVSPVVARIAGEHGIDVSQVPGTGAGGRVTKKDILAYVESGPPAAPPPAEAPAAEPAAPAAAPACPGSARGLPRPRRSPLPRPPRHLRRHRRQPLRRRTGRAGESVEPMSAMRRGVAEHMRRSLDTSAHVTSAIEVDMSAVVAIRAKLKPEYEKAYGVNPTYLAFVARAAVDTLREYPWINGEIRGESIVSRNYVNLGIAVELADGKGLIVPVIRNAEGLNLLGVTRAIADLAERSRSKKLLPDDVQGGTFTITNPGGYGTFHGTPIINQPQAAILGTYAVVKRPWVIQDARGADVIAVRPIMNVTLTYDHRLVDGALAGRFLRDLREKLETWARRDATRRMRGRLPLRGRDL